MRREYLFSKFIVIFLFIALGIPGGVSAEPFGTLQSVEIDGTTVEYYLPPFNEPELSADGLTLYSSPPVVLIADPNPPSLLLRIPPPVDLLTAQQTATATFSITYVPNGGKDNWNEPCYTFPENAKAAFNAAAAIWGNIISSPVPIAIRTCWASLSGGTLGYAGGGYLYRDFSGAPRAFTWYLSSLANALNGSDLGPSFFDVHITFNMNFSWYYGIDGNTPHSQFDFLSVVLHEIGHGLNFSGSAAFSSGQGSWGYGTGYPNIYDTFMKDGSGNNLLNTTLYPNPSAALGDLLRSNNLWFHGSNSMTANGGQRVKMYAPTTWADGSSYSHLDYATFAGTPNRLMVYAISSGSSIHDPGPVTKGLLKDLGWTISSECTYNISPTSDSFLASGGTKSVGVSTPSSCNWTAVSNASWIAIQSGSSGTGSGTVTYSVSANTSASPRTGTMTIAGYTVTINQAGIGSPTNTLTVFKTGTGFGNVTASDCALNWVGNTGTCTVNHGTAITLTCSADSGSFCLGWANCDSAVGETCSLTVNSNKSVTSTINLITSAGFGDVPNDFFTPYINALANSGITGGCGVGSYCPSNPVNRAQMALFILRGMFRGEPDPNVCTGSIFNDVNAGVFGGNPLFCAAIEEFADLGITGGCSASPPLYCPFNNVTRAQMAVFLLRALGIDPSAQTCTGVVFGDVTASSVGELFCKAIEKFAQLGITAGCGGGNYCPFNSVRRDQMAVFLGRAFLGMP